MSYQIIRKDSKYGNMKWLLLNEFASGGKHNQWFKTRAEAELEMINSIAREQSYDSRMIYERSRAEATPINHIQA